MPARLCFIAYKAKIWLGIWLGKSACPINWLESCPNSTQIWLVRFPAFICASKKRPARKNPPCKGAPAKPLYVMPFLP